MKRDKMDQVILNLCSVKDLTLKELTGLLDRHTDTLRKGYLNRLLQERKLILKYPDNVNHPTQAYITAQK